jgi:fructokinase
MNRIGIDLGGTKIEAVVLAPDGSELGRRRVPTPAGDYAATMAALAALVQEIDRGTSPTLATVGIGTPGAVSPATGLMKNSNSEVLNGHRLSADLGEVLGRPFVLRNDADCFALSEARDGAGAGARTVFGAILGTGVGGGVVVGGRLLEGPNAIAGEWGHNPLPWPQPAEIPGPPCYCGRRGCIEKFLSGPGFSALDQGTRMAPDLVAAAHAGEPTAINALTAYVDRLARSLSVVINILDPDVIVLGGGMSNVEELYNQVPAIWEDYVFSDQVSTRLVRNRWGDSSGVRGAAWLVEDAGT